MENIIKRLRKEKGLTQTQLAELLNLDQTAVSKWENGKALPDTQMLVRLAQFFDVSTDYLLGLSPLFYPDRVKTVASGLTQDEQELLKDYRALAPYLQEMLRATIQTWKGTPANANKNKRA